VETTKFWWKLFWWKLIYFGGNCFGGNYLVETIFSVVEKFEVRIAKKEQLAI
jgi:hypothetical protein